MTIEETAAGMDVLQHSAQMRLRKASDALAHLVTWEWWHGYVMARDKDYAFECAVMGEAWMRQQYTTDKLRVRWLKSAVRHTIPVGTATAVKKGPDEWEIEGQGLV